MVGSAGTRQAFRAHARTQIGTSTYARRVLVRRVRRCLLKHMHGQQQQQQGCKRENGSPVHSWLAGHLVPEGTTTTLHLPLPLSSDSACPRSVTVVAPARGSGAIAGLRGGVREAMHDRARVRHVRGLATRATRPYLPPEPYPFKGRRQKQRPTAPQIGALGP